METKEYYKVEIITLSSKLWTLRTRIDADSHKDKATRVAGEIIGQLSIIMDTLEYLIDEDKEGLEI